jgi:uncharacterized protein YggE
VFELNNSNSIKTKITFVKTTAMKVPILFCVTAIIFVSSPINAQQAQELPLISVSGSAEVKVAPDEIWFNAGVETMDPKLENAKRASDERIANVLQFLKNQGINEKDVQTDFTGVEPGYDLKISKTNPVSYTVRRSIGIKLRDVAKFDAVLSGLLANGMNHINSVDFRTSELRKHRDKARAMAIRAAREKADALAKEMGIKLGKVHNISANDSGGWWSWSGGSWWGSYRGSAMQNVSQNAGAPETAEGTLALGQISVTATVNVSFLIE